MDKDSIARLFAWEALDSRGNPTVACEVTLAGGARGQATVPSGASTGRHEVVELRDGDSRYQGRGVAAAVRTVREVIGPAVVGLEATDQSAVDTALVDLDGTENLGRLGGNAILAVSLATALAAARGRGLPLWQHLAGAAAEALLPLPMVNVVSGGAHAGWRLDIQDCLAIPVGARSFAEALEWTWRVRRATVSVAERRGFPATLVADEGGLGLALGSNREMLEIVCRGIEAAGLSPGSDVALAVDMAATQLLQPDGRYRLAADDRVLAGEALIAQVRDWADEFPLVSVEDVLGEDDWACWQRATRELADLQLIGDDLFATSVSRLQTGLDRSVANAVLVKPNQVGTLSAAAQVMESARRSGYATIVSARSGDTEDSWLADLAVGWRAGQIKVGSTMRSERTAKWNRLLRIEAQAAGASRFAGASALRVGRSGLQ